MRRVWRKEVWMKKLNKNPMPTDGFPAIPGYEHKRGEENERNRKANNDEMDSFFGSSGNTDSASSAGPTSDRIRLKR